MKRSSLVVLFLSTSIVAISQIRFGLTGGIHSSGIDEQQNISDWRQNTKPFYRSYTSFLLGIESELPLSSDQKWLFQPGIIFFKKGRNFSKFNDNVQSLATDTLFKKSSLRLTYLQIPLLLSRKYTLNEQLELSISAGPYLGFYFSGEETNEVKRTSSGEYSKRTNALETGTGENLYALSQVGYHVNIGFAIHKIAVSGFYEKSINKAYQSSAVTKFNPHSVGLKMVYWLNDRPQLIPKDQDNDGVSDTEDHCKTLPGSAKTHGCPDSDNDGVPDHTDNCPTLAGTATYKGCPIPDTDKDGINDELDACPTVAGIVTYKGCPISDTDKDGINDDEDQCPDKSGNAKYQGCPIPDTDNDGLNDELDKCPTENGPKDNNGCPWPDRDKDGIPDAIDHCPDTAGIATEFGCPAIKKEIITTFAFAAQDIHFANKSALIIKRSYAVLNKLIKILYQNPSLKIEIKGFTDNIGNPTSNQLLSQQRADAVKRYFVQKGIDPSRCNATGFGQEKPIATNATEAGRSLNRRVELIPYQ